jgi:mono/diheme cytochrome c family protein
MKPKHLELFVAAAVLSSLVAAVAVPLLVEARRRDARDARTPTITLTALMDQGAWTDEEVTAGNVRRRDFRRARPRLRVGETVHLRLASADVVHAFAAPGLGIDPVEVYPGKVVELAVTPKTSGVFEYYCTTVCGEPHFAMRGFLEVLPEDGGSLPPAPERPGRDYWVTPPPPAGSGTVARGSWLFRQQGCVTCHGEAGAGGVPNLNSMNAVVPDLASLARRSFLFAPADVAAFLAVLATDAPLEEVEEAPAVPLFFIVKTQFLATRRLLGDGRRSAKLDPAGPRPPLDMPAWGARLSDVEIDAILAYLLTLNGGGGDGADPPSSLKGEDP